jgi:hypothetical protein
MFSEIPAHDRFTSWTRPKVMVMSAWWNKAAHPMAARKQKKKREAVPRKKIYPSMAGPQ